MTSRIQLGASRLEELDQRVLRVFLDPSWLHLGDPDLEGTPIKGSILSGLTKELQKRGMRHALKRGVGGMLKRLGPLAPSRPSKDELYRNTRFEEFFYERGDRLPLEDESIGYVFSEHFLEHLFLDEATELLRECHRILRPGGVIRTCVPDADLRTYDSPEPVGYPDPKLPFTHPQKHKSRWSVYSLGEVLRVAGFRPIPLRYCDRGGRYMVREPVDIKAEYGSCLDKEMVFQMDHIMRLDSLIVDGIKE